jgi:hypothetical protein
MSEIIRPGFRIPPRHKPPPVEVILGQALELLKVQAFQIEALKRSVGREKFDASVAEMVAEGNAAKKAEATP